MAVSFASPEWHADVTGTKSNNVITCCIWVWNVMSSYVGRIQITIFENKVHEKIFKSKNNRGNMQYTNRNCVTYTGQIVFLRR
jgi:hypothetical protein